MTSIEAVLYLITNFENILSVGIILEATIQNNFSKFWKSSKEICEVEFCYSWIIISAIHSNLTNVFVVYDFRDLYCNFT